jgi:hypothetical protein
VTKRQKENDKEYLKYVRIQMWWNFIARLLIGIYELFLALIIIYAAEIKLIPFISFSFECHQSVKGNFSIIDAKKQGWGFLTMQNVLVCLSAKVSCMVFYTIPFKYNRIKKTAQELKAELIAKEKKKIEKRE